jgi:hypothetical protein
MHRAEPYRRAGLERFRSESGAGQGAEVGTSALAFSSTFVSQAANFFPKFNWANYEGAGAQPTYTSPIAQTNPVEVSVAKQMGRDSVKFGGEIRWIRGYSQNPGFNAGGLALPGHLSPARCRPPCQSATIRPW